MAPRTSTVLRARWAVRVVLRLSAAGLVVLFLWRLFIYVGVYWGDMQNFLQFGLYRGCSPLAGAIVLLLLDIFAMRWMVPSGRWVCPRCSYALDDVQGPRCPECGQRLSSEVAGAGEFER